MKFESGQIILVSMPQSDETFKKRPAMLLKNFNDYPDWLVCGISSKLHHHILGFDELLLNSNTVFADSGLKTSSLIRLGFLTRIPESKMLGVIGFIPAKLHQELLHRLVNFLLESKQ